MTPIYAEIDRLRAVNKELVKALDHAVSIAEGKFSGNWDDLLQYRALIAKAEGKP
jgi:hypothetical protein